MVRLAAGVRATVALAIALASTGGESSAVAAAVLGCTGQCLVGVADRAGGCLPKPPFTPCDDGNPCTLGDHCSGTGNVCLPGTPRVCSGQCLTHVCDPLRGCLPEPSTTPCDDHDVCTLDDHCSGQDEACVPGEARDCSGQCLSGRCDRQKGCVAKSSRAPCDDGDACTRGDHCSGRTCKAGSPVVCDAPCSNGVCDPDVGCMEDEGARGVTCHAQECVRPHLRRRLDRVVRRIERRLLGGKDALPAQMWRLTHLLGRCGVAAHAPTP